MERKWGKNSRAAVQIQSEAFCFAIKAKEGNEEQKGKKKSCHGREAN